jgi:hypothetical protein
MPIKTNQEFTGIRSVINARNIVFVAMNAVGALCIVMSASNTTAYLELTGMQHTIAIMTGIALVIFSATSFTAVQLFTSLKGFAKAFAALFLLVGVSVITFSIFSTLSLNYNKFINSPAIQADIQGQIEKKRAELLAEKQREEKTNASQWAMSSIDRLLALAEDSGESWNNSMKTIMETAQNLSNSEQEQQQQMIQDLYVETLPATFFGFMLSIKNLDTKYAFDFFMIAIPAVFYDLIAPLAMTVVLFLINTGSVKKKPKPEVKPPEKNNEIPDEAEITDYLNRAMQPDGKIILHDDEVPGMSDRRSRALREYLMTFVYKGNDVISEQDGQYVSYFNRENLIKFYALQFSIKRKEENDAL